MAETQFKPRGQADENRVYHDKKQNYQRRDVHPSRTPEGRLLDRKILHDLQLVLNGAQPDDPRLIHFRVVDEANRDVDV